MPHSDLLCYCGSDKPFSACCQPFLLGESLPTTAEALMRSRFCAFRLNNTSYLIETTHPTQQATIKQQAIYAPDPSIEWVQLEVIKTKKGRARDKTGTVEFKAWWQPVTGGERQCHHEVSDFANYASRWYFIYPNLPLK